MNELTDTHGGFDGRMTGGLKGLMYDVSALVGLWDDSLVLTDADVSALLER